jgi:hypothetical protein
LSDCGVGATFAEQIGAKAVSPPMRDRIYKEYPPGKAPERLQRLASKIRDANGPQAKAAKPSKGRFNVLPTIRRVGRSGKGATTTQGTAILIA